MKFASAETVKIDLKDGEWIEIKQDLSKSESIRYQSAGLGNRTANGVEIDWVAMAFGRVVAYLVDWSFKGTNGKDVPVTKAALESLSSETFDEIDAAIVAHLEAREQEKKAPAASPNSTSPSP